MWRSWARRFRAAVHKDDRDLTGLLIILAVTIFVVTPLETGALVRSEVMLGMFALLCAAGVNAVSNHPAGLWITAALAIIAILLDLTARLNPTQLLRLLDLLARLLFTVLLGSVVTVRVFRAGNVSHHRIQGAIVVYLLCGLLWAYLYEMLVLIDPSAIHFSTTGAWPAAHLSGWFRYFSFVTLTTLGYGDILPVSPIARALTTLEALCGQLYPAVIVARLVTLELAHGKRIKAPP